MDKITSVEQYLAKHENWCEGLVQLRGLLLDTELQEQIKWGAPVYCLNGQNLIGMAAFTDYFGLWFFQGALLQDNAKVLVNAQEGKTQAMRQWRFGSAAELDRPLVQSYVLEAMALAQSGKRIKPQQKPLMIPPELQTALNADAKLNQAFTDLGLTKQREFADHINEAKRDSTKASRLEKIIPMIRSGTGLHDKYR